MSNVTDIVEAIAKKGLADVRAQLAENLKVIGDEFLADSEAMTEAADPHEFTDLVQEVSEKLAEASELWSKLWETLRDRQSPG